MFSGLQVISLSFSMLRQTNLQTNEQHQDLQVCFADNNVYRWYLSEQQYSTPRCGARVHQEQYPTSPNPAPCALWVTNCGRGGARGGWGGLAGDPAIWTMISSPAGVCLHTPLTCPPPPGRPPRTRKQNSLIVSSPREQFAICPLFKHLHSGGCTG